jgi:hypothetical protein
MHSFPGEALYFKWSPSLAAAGFSSLKFSMLLLLRHGDARWPRLSPTQNTCPLRGRGPDY